MHTEKLGDQNTEGFLNQKTQQTANYMVKISKQKTETVAKQCGAY